VNRNTLVLADPPALASVRPLGLGLGPKLHGCPARQKGACSRAAGGSVTQLGRHVALTIVVPCYNEESTLEDCIERVRAIASEELSLDIVIVDDASKDGSLAIARGLADRFDNVRVLAHPHNQGKGAALRTGFREASGEFVAVQDADLEYDPMDLRRLLVPLVQGHADVVYGSRFLPHGAHRVLYFWHYMGNMFLTFLSNMFTDINLTDMETCYKVFKREVIQSIDIQENRFGFEPEVTAKITQIRPRLRIFEMGISYYGRTYEEGKKIGARDGFRALYCIMRYNAPHAPLPMQFVIYVFIGGVAAVFNLLAFLGLVWVMPVVPAAVIAYVAAAVLNYLLSIAILFRHKARWSSTGELAMYMLVVAVGAALDAWLTPLFAASGMHLALAKALASLVGLVYNFLGRKYAVFPLSQRA
jgi:glycosyltransferase involved in cell wall biosynthesis